MLRKLALTCLLLAATVGVAPQGSLAAHAVETGAALTHTAPTAPGAPRADAAPERVALSTVQMSETTGDGLLTKIWKTIKKNIRKIVNFVINIILDEVFSQTQQQVASLSQDVTEYYEGTQETTNTYASQTDYDLGYVQSTSYYDSGYLLQSRQYSCIRGECYNYQIP